MIQQREMMKVQLKSIVLLTLIAVLLIGCSSANELTSEAEELITTSPQTSPVNSPNNSESLIVGSTPFQSLIPLGWHVLAYNQDAPVMAEGDLNKDGVLDIAAVIEKDQEGEDSLTAAPRSLLIALGQGSESYSLSIIADGVVLNADDGGVWGDPFDSLTIDNGSVLLSHFGGSNWRWYNKYRFRLQDEDWYLIGATMGEYFTGDTELKDADERDYNLLTGDYIFKLKDEQGVVQIEKGNRGKKELVKLSDFDLEKM